MKAPDQGRKRNRGRVRELETLAPLPPKASLGEMTFREHRPEDTLVSEAGAKPGEGPVAGGEITSGAHLEEPMLLASKRHALNLDPHFHRSLLETKLLESEEHQPQNPPRLLKRLINSSSKAPSRAAPRRPGLSCS